MKVVNVIGALSLAWAVLFTIALIVTSAALSIDKHFSVDPEYRKAIGGHITAAYWADTPELMIEELRSAEEGMVSIGLDPSQYCDLRPWHHTPDCTMDFQYRELDSTIARAEDVIQWRDNQQQGGDQLGDVYGEKMRDLRSFIAEGCDRDSDGNQKIETGCGLDEIAYGAFYVQEHPLHAFWWDYGAILFSTWITNSILFGGFGFAIASRW